MNTLRIFLMAALILVVFGVSNVEAEKEPLWNYTIGETVNSIDISEDGKYTVTGSLVDPHPGQGVRLFDSHSGELLWEYILNEEVKVSISADGNYIVAGSWNDLVYLFSKDSNTPLWSYDIGYDVSDVDISADGEYLVAGTSYEVCLFNEDSSTPLWCYETDDEYKSVSISADGEYVAVGSKNAVQIFRKDSNEPLWSYTTENDYVEVAISSNGDYIAVISNNWNSDDEVSLFHKYGDTPLWNYSIEYPISSVAISGEGHYIIVGTEDKWMNGAQLYLFDKGDNNPLWINSFVNQTTITSVDISNDSKYIVVSSNCCYEGEKQGIVSLFDINGNSSWNHTLYESKIRTVVISQGGDYVAAGSEKDSESGIYLFYNEPSASNEENNEKDIEEEETTSTNETIEEDEETLAGQCTCPDGSKGQMVGPADDDGVDDGCLCAISEEDSSLPSISLIPALITIGIIALRRRY